MFIKEVNPHGGDIYNKNIIYDFSANTSPLGTPPDVIEAMQKAALEVNNYPDPYCRALVGAISDKYGLSRDYIICGNGAAELIYSYVQAIRPDRAVIMSPTFCEYGKALESVDCPITFVDYSLDKSKVVDNYREFENVDVLFMCNPNNPTGRAIDVDTVEAFIRNVMAVNKNINIFIDECFCDLTDNPERISFKDRLKEYENVFLLKAFTKSYGMAGVRLGFGLCCNEEILRVMSGKVQGWNVSTIAQKAGIAALQCDAFIERNRSIIKSERQFITDELRKMDFEVRDSDANFILFRDKLRGQRDLYKELLDKGILIRNCGNYQGLDSSFYRCAVRTHEENEAFIKAISM